MTNSQTAEKEYQLLKKDTKHQKLTNDLGSSLKNMVPSGSLGSQDYYKNVLQKRKPDVSWNPQNGQILFEYYN